MNCYPSRKSSVVPRNPGRRTPAFEFMTRLEVARRFERLQREHGLEGWKLTISSRIQSSLGLCYYDRREIRLAAWMWSQDLPSRVIKDTLLHEVAHAISGRRAGHGPKWRSVARSLGAVPRPRNADVPYERSPMGSRGPKYQGVCSRCGPLEDYRMRAPARRDRYVHRSCGARVRYDPLR
jgi:predicted SprT family Zn-dependent metalloprotease